MGNLNPSSIGVRRKETTATTADLNPHSPDDATISSGFSATQLT
jgi:hypothetical protein